MFEFLEPLDVESAEWFQAGIDCQPVGRVPKKADCGDGLPVEFFLIDRFGWRLVVHISFQIGCFSRAAVGALDLGKERRFQTALGPR